MVMNGRLTSLLFNIILAEKQQISYLTLKIKVKLMAKIKLDDDIWGLEFNRYVVCFSFRGNRTIFGWDIASPIFDLEYQRSM